MQADLEHPSHIFKEHHTYLILLEANQLQDHELSLHPVP